MRSRNTNGKKQVVFAAFLLIFSSLPTSAKTSIIKANKLPLPMQPIVAQAQTVEARKTDAKCIQDEFYEPRDMLQAFKYLQNELERSRQAKDLRREALTLSILGWEHRGLDNYSKALELLQQSLDISRRLHNREMEVYALVRIGLTYCDSGNYTKAIEVLQQSLAISRATNSSAVEGNILAYLGLVYRTQGEPAKAISAFQQSLEIARKVKNQDVERIAWVGLGGAYLQSGNAAKAVEILQQSLEWMRRTGNNDSRSSALINLGLAWLQLGKFSTAEKTLWSAVQTVEQRDRFMSSPDLLRIDVFEDPSQAYILLQQALIAQNKEETALEVSERGRLRVLINLMASRLSQNWDGQEKLASPPTIDSLRQQAKAQKSTLVEYSIIQNNLNVQGQAQTGDFELFIWVIQQTGEVAFRKTSLKSSGQNQNSSLKELAQQTRYTIGARDRADIEVAISDEATRADKGQVTQLQELHKLLIEPIADLLPKNPNARVIFIPQGELFLVPFPALQDADGKYLIEKHTILTAPSIQLLELTRKTAEEQRSKGAGDRQPALIVGNPIMPKVVTRAGDSPVQLAALQGAEQEAVAIASLFKTQAITGKQATETEVVRQMPNARLIHFATHGLLDDFKGLGIPGAIALAPAGNGQLNDGLLTADEILDMKLNAELVVLSACDTGRGRITGDGVIGLSRSFITAGVPSVMVSLWKVPDESTALLMSEFYQNLSKTSDKAQALRQAMLTTKQKYVAPLDWAAFTLIGEAE